MWAYRRRSWRVSPRPDGSSTPASCTTPRRRRAISASAVEAPSAAPSASDSATPPHASARDAQVDVRPSRTARRSSRRGTPTAPCASSRRRAMPAAGAIAKSFIDQVKVGAATTGPCKMSAFSHPRLGYSGNVGRPAVAVTSKGAVVAWTDDHESSGHDHVYSVLLDASGRADLARARPDARGRLRASSRAADGRRQACSCSSGTRAAASPASTCAGSMPTGASAG